MRTTPAVFGYASTSDRYTDRDDTLQRQAKKIEEYYAHSLAHMAQGHIVTDTIAGNRPFHLRPKGGKLDRVLKKGDAIIIAASHRAFPDLRQLVWQVKEWMDRGVEVHMPDLFIDTTRKVGLFAFDVIQLAAEFNVQRKRDRSQDRSNYTGRDNGGYPPRPNGGYPYGLTKNGNYIYSHELRAEVKELIRLLDVERLTYRAVWLKLLKERKKIPALVHFRSTREWTPNKVARLVEQERQLQLIEEAFPDFKFPKRLQAQDESVYRSMAAMIRGIKKPSGDKSEFPLVSVMVGKP